MTTRTENSRYLATDKSGALTARTDTITVEQEEALEAARAGDWSAFDVVVVAFSGGKDSLACLLWCLDHGCPKEKLELWHHEIDGREAGEFLMDWPVTAAYCRAIAEHFDIPLFFSWKQGGFVGEMTRHEARTQPTSFERPNGDAVVVDCVSGRPRKDGKDLQTRMRFPAIAADLQTRWCSAYLKIDVAKKVFANDPRFKAGRHLLITGERREESKNRSRYAEAVQHASSNLKREVIQWRPVIDETEQQVWDRISAYKIQPHPAYALGFGRVSCAFCIFGNASQFRTAQDILPEQFERLAGFEARFQGYWSQQEANFSGTLKGQQSLRELVAEGEVYESAKDETLRQQAASSRWSLPVIQPSWELPAGAFKECGGPV